MERPTYSSARRATPSRSRRDASLRRFRTASGWNSTCPMSWRHCPMLICNFVSRGLTSYADSSLVRWRSACTRSAARRPDHWRETASTGSPGRRRRYELLRKWPPSSLSRGPAHTFNGSTSGPRAATSRIVARAVNLSRHGQVAFGVVGVGSGPRGARPNLFQIHNELGLKRPP
jgi:hypothetical protein